MRFLIVLLIVFSASNIRSQPGKEFLVIQKLLKANDYLNTAKFTLFCEERMMDGSVVISERKVKLSTRPKQIYFYSIKPDPGTEVIWREGWNEEKMYVSLGGFPFINFSLSPTGSFARNASHQPVFHIGFEYFTELMRYYIQLMGERFYENLSISDTLTWDNRSCIRLVFDFPEYKRITYRIKSGEDISKIARKFHLNDYSILMLNRKIKSYDDVREGDTITIPNYYCSKMEIYIDRNSWLPVRQLIYDTEGLYEKYEMRNFIANPVIRPEEFSSDYDEYGF